MSGKSLINELNNLRKTERKLANEIQNLENLIHGTPDNTILIPGQEIPLYSKKKKQKAYYREGTQEKAPLFNLPEFDSNVLLTPIVATKFYADTQTILVNTVAFINIKQNPKHFSLFFNYTLSENGEPQINIYICYDDPELTARRYMIRPFTITFTNNSIKNGSGSIVPLKQIKTVKVFLVNQDPKTSRGTMTTVQHQTSG